MRLSGKVALLSGVGSRFGKAVAYLFAREGAKIVLISRKSDLIKEIARTITDNGGVASWYQCDATDEDQVRQVVKKVVDEHGRIDIVLNNAGGSYTRRQRIEDMTEVDWMGILTQNIKSAYLLSKWCLPVMRHNKRGSIIMVSAASKTLVDGNSAYGTAKMGIIGLVRNLAREYASDNIRVNGICPGAVRRETKDYSLSAYEPTLCKTGQPEDVAFVALFLASDESCWITGETISVDGGEGTFADIPRSV